MQGSVGENAVLGHLNLFYLETVMEIPNPRIIFLQKFQENNNKKKTKKKLIRSNVVFCSTIVLLSFCFPV